MEKTSSDNDFKLSSEEANRLKNAFQNDEFLKLFQEYAEDIINPESRDVYEKEIVSMEKERGYDVEFIHPEPLYVMKFSKDGTKTFVNICKNQHVRKATYERKNDGTEWQIPVLLSKPREDIDKNRNKCMVIDVMFHPNTMELSTQNKRFRDIVEDTALSTIQKQFKIDCNLRDAKYPKMKYKGKPPSLILRKNKKEGFVCEPIQEYWNKLLKNKKQNPETKPVTQESNTTISMSDKSVQEPQYSIKYRDIIDMKDFSLMGYTDRAAPKSIIIEIQLPSIGNSSEVELEVSEKKLLLESKPGMKHTYRLNLDLSYSVDKQSGSAKFDKTSKILTISLHVKEREIPIKMR